MVRKHEVTAAMVAAATGLAVSQWPMRCFEVAMISKQANILPGELRYGLFRGPIDDKSLFAGRGFARHGWLEDTAKKVIIDPTRWVFDGLPPTKAYVAKISIRSEEWQEYDVGGGTLRDLHAAMKPDAESCAKLPAPWNETLDVPWPDPIAGFFWGMFNNMPLYRAQIKWVVGRQPSMLGDFAKPIYELVIQHVTHGRAYIPLDYRQVVLGNAYGNPDPPSPGRSKRRSPS